jgi:hypothetical protein
VKEVLANPKSASVQQLRMGLNGRLLPETESADARQRRLKGNPGAEGKATKPVLRRTKESEVNGSAAAGRGKGRGKAGGGSKNGGRGKEGGKSRKRKAVEVEEAEASDEEETEVPEMEISDSALELND